MSPEKIGLVLIVLSCAFYAGLLVVPFAPLTPPGKVALSAGLVISGEGVFWIGCVIVGKELMRRYRHHLNPRTWFRKMS